MVDYNFFVVIKSDLADFYRNLSTFEIFCLKFLNFCFSFGPRLALVISRSLYNTRGALPSTVCHFVESFMACIRGIKISVSDRREMKSAIFLMMPHKRNDQTQCLRPEEGLHSFWHLSRTFEMQIVFLNSFFFNSVRPHVLVNNNCHLMKPALVVDVYCTGLSIYCLSFVFV